MCSSTINIFRGACPGLVPDGDTRGSYPIPRVHSYFSRNRLRRCREKYWWVCWLHAAATCRSEPGQARRKRSELKQYVFVNPMPAIARREDRAIAAVTASY